MITKLNLRSLNKDFVTDSPSNINDTGRVFGNKKSLSQKTGRPVRMIIGKAFGKLSAFGKISAGRITVKTAKIDIEKSLVNEIIKGNHGSVR